MSGSSSFPEQAATMARDRSNEAFLPGVQFPENLRTSADPFAAAEGAELVSLLATAERAIDEAYRPDGVNIGVNRGACAGAGVAGHLHFHLVPRWCGDTNFMTSLAETRVVSEDLEDSWRRLAPFFGG